MTLALNNSLTRATGLALHVIVAAGSTAEDGSISNTVYCELLAHRLNSEIERYRFEKSQLANVPLPTSSKS